MKEFIALIDQQFQFNRKRNLLCQEPLSDFSFSPAMVAYVNDNITKFRRMEAREEELLLEHLAAKAIETFCLANQYYYFNSFDRNALKKINKILLKDIANLPDDAIAESLHTLAKRH